MNLPVRREGSPFLCGIYPSFLGGRGKDLNLRQDKDGARFTRGVPFPPLPRRHAVKKVTLFTLVVLGISL